MESSDSRDEYAMPPPGHRTVKTVRPNQGMMTGDAGASAASFDDPSAKQWRAPG